MDDVKLDLGDAASNHSQRFGRGIGDVDNPAANYGPRSLTRTVTDRPVVTLVTRNWVPNGNVG